MLRTDPAMETLIELVGDQAVLTGGRVRPYLHDATEARGLRGSASAVVRPRDAAEVATVMTWCYDHDVPLTPQGGRTGYAGGAVPQGGVVLSLDRLRDVRAFEPLLWRGEFEAGITTADVRRMARENGLLFPPDPGAAEQSQIGGNVATNAGGPHAFKYGVTGAWVTGLEAVVPPGEIVRVGGFVRKDVAGYDLKSRARRTADRPQQIHDLGTSAPRPARRRARRRARAPHRRLGHARRRRRDIRRAAHTRRAGGRVRRARRRVLARRARRGRARRPDRR